jgi:hypothetical protein
MRSNLTVFVLCLAALTFFVPAKAHAGLFDFLHRRHRQEVDRADRKKPVKHVKQKPPAKPKRYRFQQQGS